MTKLSKSLKVANPKLTTKDVLASLKKLGFKIEEPGTGDYVLLEDKKDKTWDDGDEINHLSIESENLPYCCGVDELGDLSLDKVGAIRDKNSREGTKLLIQYAFINEADTRTVKKAKKATVATPVIFCSNGKGGCVNVEEAMADMPNNFLLVSTSQNGTGGSVIKVYISKS